MLQNPEIRDQVYSLYLPNDRKCFQIKIFWTFFSVDQFSNLPKLEFILLSENTSDNSSPFDMWMKDKMEPTSILLPRLRSLSMDVDGSTLSITHLTVAYCALEDLYHLL